MMPAISKRVDYEGEIGVIIARKCFAPGTEGRRGPYIAGFTCLNDVTARDLQKSDGQWTRGKGFDTFCPFGPGDGNRIRPWSGDGGNIFEWT